MSQPARTDLSISLKEANWYSLLLALPVAVLLSAVYIFRWGAAAFFGGISALLANLPVFIVIFIAAVVAHEAIHALAWMAFGRKPREAIRFGFQAKTLTPYAHCKEPMEVRAYRLGTLMPGLVLGVLPSLYAILTGSGWAMAFGLLFVIAAGGDFVVLWLLRSAPAGSQVEDHPSRAGCYLLEPAE